MEELEVTIKLPATLAIRIQKLADAAHKSTDELCSQALHFFFSPNSEGWDNFGVKRDRSEKYPPRTI